MCTSAQSFLGFSAARVISGALKHLDVQAKSKPKCIRVPWGRTQIFQTMKASASSSQLQV